MNAWPFAPQSTTSTSIALLRVKCCYTLHDSDSQIIFVLGYCIAAEPIIQQGLLVCKLLEQSWFRPEMCTSHFAFFAWWLCSRCFQIFVNPSSGSPLPGGISTNPFLSRLVVTMPSWRHVFLFMM